MAGSQLMYLNLKTSSIRIGINVPRHKLSVIMSENNEKVLTGSQKSIFESWCS